MKQIILINQGETEFDIKSYPNSGLSEKGTEEAREAGRVMKMGSLNIDVAFTSHQSAAIKTLWLALEEMDRMWIPVYKSSDLNQAFSQSTDEEKPELIVTFWEEEIFPYLGLHDTLLVVAHSSILKILLAEIGEHIEPDFVFPYGVPYVTKLNEDFEVEKGYFVGS